MGTSSGKVTMFDVEVELDTLLDAMVDDDFPLDAEDEMLASALGAAESKRDAVAYKIEGFDRDAAKFREYARMFTDRARQYENKSDKLRGMVQRIMEMLGRKEWKGQVFRFKVATNPSRVIVNDAGVLADEYKRTEVTFIPDKKAIKEAIEAGKDVEGAGVVPGDLRVDIKLV